MGCGASRDDGSGSLEAAEPAVKVADLEADNLEDEESQAEALKAIHAGITTAGLKSPALGPPEVPPPEQYTPLIDLPDCLTDLHDGMPPAVQQTPMRLIKISVVLASWGKLKLYEEIDVAAEALELPYSDTDDDLWRRVVTISWRWAEPKPAELQPGFSPMAEEQFQELRTLLKVVEGRGVELLWIDWSCVPQYSRDSMVEVHRSKVFFARSRAMYVLPTFHPLPGEGPVRLILAKARRVLSKRAEMGSMRCLVAAAVIDGILAKNLVAGREYFGRVWTLAERMARYGRGEGLWQWLSLEAWLGMLVDAMLKSTEDKVSSQIYKKMLGQSAAGLLDAVLAPLAAAVRTGSVQARAAEGLERKVADLCKAAVGVWLSPSLLAEAPNSQWLHAYLGEEARSGVYQAFSESDRVWAIYSYFCWKSHLDRRSAEALVTALEDLVEIAAGDRREYRAGMFAQLGIDGRSPSEKRREEEEQQAIAAAALAAVEQRKRDEEALQAARERRRQEEKAAAAAAAERKKQEEAAEAAAAERRKQEQAAEAAMAERKKQEAATEQQRQAAAEAAKKLAAAEAAKMRLAPTPRGKTVDLDGSTIKYNATTGSGVGAVKANNPIPADSKVFYYEVTIVNRGEKGTVGIGFGAHDTAVHRFPGWDKDTYGYHGDNGKLYRSSGTGVTFGPLFSTGDIIGVGIHVSMKLIFFTRNGTLVNMAHMGHSPRSLYPMVGLSSRGEIVTVNFGEQPFRYTGIADPSFLTIPTLQKGCVLNTSKRGSNLQVVDARTIEWRQSYGSAVGAIQGSMAILPGRRLFYYEITIQNRGQKGTIAIGFGPSNTSLERQPGWDANTYGYHADDGHVFMGSGTGQQYGPKCMGGDVMGAGIDMLDNRLFFTKNGVKQGTLNIKPPNALYPMIGLHSQGEKVSVNFGERTFQYDPKNFA